MVLPDNELESNKQKVINRFSPQELTDSAEEKLAVKESSLSTSTHPKTTEGHWTKIVDSWKFLNP